MNPVLAEAPQPYPPPNLWTKVELEVDIEPEPAMLQVSASLALPAAWPEERRAAWLIRLDAAEAPSLQPRQPLPASWAWVGV